MNDHTTSPYDFEPEDEKSKTQIKREMTELQELGATLSTFKEDKLRRLPLTEKLIEALLETQRIKHKSALKRHYQFIGKLMRDVDSTALSNALASMDEQSHRKAKQAPQVEIWLSRLLDSPDAVSDFITQYPACNLQKIRQFIRQAQKEQSINETLVAENKPTNSVQRKKLFRAIQETLSAEC